VARLSVIAATHPLTSGAAHFNAAMVGAMRARAEVDLISWRRLYPPLLYRGRTIDEESRPPRVEPAVFLLDWLNPRSWRAALDRVARFRPAALVLPWLHPISSPPYRFLLRHAPAGVRRVVICHNVETHERVPAGRRLTRATLGYADVLVTHAPQQRDELARLGLAGIPVIEAFHPWFAAEDLAVQPSAAEVLAERARLGDPDLVLCCFGAVRPYKGVDVGIEALARVDPALSVRLVVAGRFWEGRDDFEAQVRRLGLENRVEFRDRYVSNEEAALLFASSDAALLPYRSASQSGVAALAFAHGRPVIATRVGGLPAAVRDGEDGLLCAPEDPDALARAIERVAVERERLAVGVRRRKGERSFARYAELLERAVV
jgi:glycosyltransferase involved in cell wall biosynthesis